VRVDFTLFYLRYKFRLIIASSICIVLLVSAILVIMNFRDTGKSNIVNNIEENATIDTNIGKPKQKKQEAAADSAITIHNLMPKIAKTINDYLIVSTERYIKGNEDVLLTTSPYYPMALSQVEMGGEWSKDDNILAAIGVNTAHFGGHPENVLSMTWKDIYPRPDPNAKYVGPLQLAWNYNNEWNDTTALNAAKITELGRMFAANGTIRKDITRSIANTAKPFRMVTGDRCNWTDAVNLLYWAMVLDHGQIPKNSFVRKMNEYGRMAFSAMCHNYSGALAYNTDNIKKVYNVTETMTQAQVEAWCACIGSEDVVNNALGGVRRARPLQYKNDSLCNSIVSNVAESVRANYQGMAGKGSTLGNIPAVGDIRVTDDKEKTLYPIKVLVAFLITKCRMNGEW
jgi:hypothetical protein